jgi:hypothetical protein
VKRVASPPTESGWDDHWVALKVAPEQEKSRLMGRLFGSAAGVPLRGFEPRFPD